MVQTRSQSAAKQRAVEHPVSDVPPLTWQPWQLNYDVLLHIAAYANPRDLFSLSLTCKHVRELLTDESSELVWKTARSHIIGLPDCPFDLTEQEYADLTFCPRCHGCGKYTDTIFWEMRHRYCRGCRHERLCPLDSCPWVIQTKLVLGLGQRMSVGNGNMDIFPADDVNDPHLWVDREQMKAFSKEYNHSVNKRQLLNEQKKLFLVISEHAIQCKQWEKAEHKSLLEERERRIFERLEQLGYQTVIEFCGRYGIRDSHKALFNMTKPLTDKEWDRIWPKWEETMERFRLARLERLVYQSRRSSLVHEYRDYVDCSSPNISSFDIFPHVAEVARFPPFRDIIRAPEETPMNDKKFELALAQLPEFVAEWKKKLDIEFAELVQIPSHLSSNDPPGSQDIASNSTTNSQPSQISTAKLRLACALFKGDINGILAYPDLLLTCMRSRCYPSYREDDFEPVVSLKDQFDIKYVEEAPYIVHACGLDPNVATTEDMDRRNPRLKCLQGSCGSDIYEWREAIWHAFFCHTIDGASWQLLDDDSEEMKEIRDAELADEKEGTSSMSRCLLCRPRVGGAMQHFVFISHIIHDHGIEQSDVKQGVHYLPVVMEEFRSFRKVQRGGQGPFKYEASWGRLWR